MEDIVLRFFVLPAVFRIADVWLDNPAKCANLAARLAQECRTVESASADQTPWRDASQIIEAAFGEHRSRSTLNHILQTTSLNRHVRTMAWISFGLDDDRSVGEVMGAQLAAVKYASECCSAFYFRQFITPFVTDYWVRLVQQQEFRFSPPALAREDILAASREPAPRRAKAVLRAAMSGLCIKGIPPSFHDWLRS